MTFDGFDVEAVESLDELPGLSPDDYAARKQQLAAGLTKPGLALMTELAERLDAELTVSPRSSVSPLHRDLRFAAPGSPRYKDHLLLRFWEGDSRKTSPTLFLRVGKDAVGYATGAVLPDLARWRNLIDDEATGAPLAAELATLGGGRDLDIDGRHYKAVPKPYPADHPRADLLRHKMGLQARWMEKTPTAVGSAAFVDHCMERLTACAPVHRWFVDNL